LNPTTALININNNATTSVLNSATSTTATTITTNKRTPTNATLKRATSNLHRVHSVFAPLELKHKTSLVYAAAAHSTTTTTTTIPSTNITSCSSKGTASASRNSGYPPLPPASEVFTVFGKGASPLPAASPETTTGMVAIAEIKSPKQRNVKTTKASTTDDLPVSQVNIPLFKAPTGEHSITLCVAKNTAEMYDTSAGTVPIT